MQHQDYYKETKVPTLKEYCHLIKLVYLKTHYKITANYISFYLCHTHWNFPYTSRFHFIRLLDLNAGSFNKKTY